MQFKFFLTLGLAGAVLCSAGTPNAKPDLYAKAIQQLGGTVVDASNFPATVVGFQEFLSKTGVNSITAVDLTHPNHPEVAARLGFQNFLPPREWWSRGAALALLTQQIKTATSAPVTIRNWWRPAAYNTDPAVKGAKNGDHPTANAVDLDYPTVAARMKAELFLRNLHAQNPWMQLSLGLGALTTHIGLGSPRGHREWHYAGWQAATSRKANG